MLRDFQYEPSPEQLHKVLRQFDLDDSSATAQLDILRFEVLSPDSFVWRIVLNRAVYYLYAEDYLEDLDYLKNTLNDYIGSDSWVLVKPRELLVFENSSPVKGASIYVKNPKKELLMEYAVDSGYDFVFLAKTLENSDDAHFVSRT